MDDDNAAEPTAETAHPGAGVGAAHPGAGVGAAHPGAGVGAAHPGAGVGAVLPRTRSQVLVAVAALMFLAGAAGYALGRRGATDDRSRESADVGFLYDMAAHHQQALALANLELTNGTDPAAQRWARDILRAQAYEIGLMEMKLGQLGHDPADRPDVAMAWMGAPVEPAAMPGLASADELATLTAATGADADALFYALMIDHHRAGVAMAESGAAEADDEWVADTAGALARIQSSEIAEMTADRERAGLSTTPPGYVADDSGPMDHTHDG